MSNQSRNDLCPCGSGLKYKKCCLSKKGMLKHKVNVINSSVTSKISSSFFGKKDKSNEQDS